METRPTQTEAARAMVARFSALHGLPMDERKTAFAATARDCIAEGLAYGSAPRDGRPTLMLFGRGLGLPREFVESTADAVIGEALQPTPDTAPDTVVTGSPPPAAYVGVDLAEGDDSTSVVVIDNEVS